MTKEECIEPAVDHFGQIELGFEALRVISLTDEIAGREIDVGVEGDHFLVDRPRFFHQRCLRRSIVCASVDERGPAADIAITKESRARSA